VYIPQFFATSFIERDKYVTGVSQKDWEILEEGPNHEHYWEVWTEVLDKAVVTDWNGVVYSLHQDGDLWLVPKGMEWSDELEMYEWPSEETTS
jgi:hypothetical protein